MRYFVTFDPNASVSANVECTGDDTTCVDIAELPSGALEVRVGGKLVEADVVKASGALSVRVDGRVIDLTTEGKVPELGVVAGGVRTYLHVESERDRAAKAASKGKGLGADNRVLSPMPGRVVKVLVSEGDAVTQGQALCVVEAMKMENEIRAKRAGTIGKVHVEAGAAVEGNAVLVTFA